MDEELIPDNLRSLGYFVNLVYLLAIPNPLGLRRRNRSRSFDQDRYL
jgi:hypothetical protein